MPVARTIKQKIELRQATYRPPSDETPRCGTCQRYEPDYVGPQGQCWIGEKAQNRKAVHPFGVCELWTAKENP